MPRDLEKEREMELAAIWGTEGSGTQRYPKRRRGGKKPLDAMDGADVSAADINADDVLSDVSDDDEPSRTRDHGEENEEERRKKKKRKAERPEYRLHCFVEPGTEKNDVRTAFEAYNPKVEIRTSQKGSLLNKTQFAVLTFPNKAMALHAVQMMDGTNQRDLLGTPKLKLSIMLSREQSRLVRKNMNKKSKKDQEQRLAEEVKEDTEFIKRFLKENLKR
eukprot:gene4891-3508_t